MTEVDPLLSVQGATVSFGERRRGERGQPRRALDDVSLELEEGQVLGILGPSGSGKSTLLRAVAGLERLDTGRIVRRGEDITALAVHRRRFALMFQDGQLFANRSVASNIGYPLTIARKPAEPRVGELLALVGLEGFGTRRVTELSGGEQQRVALARALAADPDLLLLDEPLSSLDRELRERLARDLRRILTETGTPAILVTHDHSEAVAIADRLGIMLDGRLVQVGSPRDVLDAPADDRIARFLGTPGT